MTEPETTLIAELDKRQDLVLDELDSLNEKILATLSDWTTKPADDTTQQDAAA